MDIIGRSYLPITSGSWRVNHFLPRFLKQWFSLLIDIHMLTLRIGELIRQHPFSLFSSPICLPLYWYRGGQGIMNWSAVLVKGLTLYNEDYQEYAWHLVMTEWKKFHFGTWVAQIWTDFRWKNQGTCIFRRIKIDLVLKNSSCNKTLKTW